MLGVFIIDLTIAHLSFWLMWFGVIIKIKQKAKVLHYNPQILDYSVMWDFGAYLISVSTHFKGGFDPQRKKTYWCGVMPNKVNYMTLKLEQWSSWV